ncbi:zinc finger and SCAN domain-containing protein 30-like [Lineus longissimus]|uniref:zinc finger and SCAN domain-containing protein 30-like n=1 Tax=Lineus longissimus TaxID=88925 RepID=UPI00315CD04F
MSEQSGMPTKQQNLCALRALKIEMDVRGSVLHQTWNELSDLIGKYQGEVEIALSSDHKCDSSLDESFTEFQEQKTLVKEQEILLDMKKEEIKNLKDELDMLKTELGGVREALEMKDKMLDKIQKQMVRENKEWSDEVTKMRQYLCDEQRQKQAVMQQYADLRQSHQSCSVSMDEENQSPNGHDTPILVSEGFTYVEPEAPEEDKNDEEHDLKYQIRLNVDEDGNSSVENPMFAVDENSRIYVNVEDSQFNVSNNSDDVVVEKKKKRSSELMERLKKIDPKLPPSALEKENPILSSLIGSQPAKKARLAKNSQQKQNASTSGVSGSQASLPLPMPLDTSLTPQMMQNLLGYIPSEKPDQSYRCEKCGQEFENKYGLVTHRWTNACSRVKSAIQNLSPDLIADTKSDNYDPEKPFKCERCTKTFKSVQGLQTHRKHFSCVKDGSAAKTGWFNKESSPASKFLCKFCGESFNTKQVLLEHEHVHKTMEPNKCFFCHRNFDDQTALLIHQKLTGHQKPTNRCQFCEESFETNEDLEKHIAVHKKNGDGKVTFMCPSCPKSFSKEISLLSHQKVHVDDNPNPISPPSQQNPLLSPFNGRDDVNALTL